MRCTRRGNFYPILVSIVFPPEPKTYPLPQSFVPQSNPTVSIFIPNYPTPHPPLPTYVCNYPCTVSLAKDVMRWNSQTQSQRVTEGPLVACLSPKSPDFFLLTKYFYFSPVKIGFWKDPLPDLMQQSFA